MTPPTKLTKQPVRKNTSYKFVDSTTREAAMKAANLTIKNSHIAAGYASIWLFMSDRLLSVTLSEGTIMLDAPSLSV